MTSLDEGGRRWAYAGVIVGFSVSITANVTNTVLSGDGVPLWLRVPFAAVWPVLTYIAIEVITRTDWRSVNPWTGSGVKAILWIPVGFVAAFVSYLHQHHLMQLANEPGLAQAFGPLAVDGLLFGCTATLIVTRMTSSRIGRMVFDYPMPIGPMPMKLTVPNELLEPTQIDPMAAIQRSFLQAADSYIAPTSPAAPRAPRAPRSSWDAAKVIAMILEDSRDSEIMSATGVSPASLGRFKKVIRTLKADPHASIAESEKVRPEFVEMMRKAIAR
jgi:hypothetical protein